MSSTGKKRTNKSDQQAIQNTPEKGTKKACIEATPQKSVLSPTAISPRSPYSGETSDFSGFVTSISSAKSKTGNEYIDVRLKTDVYHYSTVRIMKKQNPLIREIDLRTLQVSNVPAKFRNVSVTANGTLFFNTFRGSKIEEGVPVNFKFSDKSNISINDIKLKGSGTFTVRGCLKWFGQIQTHKTKFGDDKELRECILYDGDSHILMTIWDKLLKQGLRELTQWYTFTDVNIKNYFGIKLTTTALTTAQENDKADNPEINWEKVDIKSYEQNLLESEKCMHPIICCPEILNVKVDVYKACTSSLCQKKVIILPGERVVHCTSCNRRMKAVSCFDAFEATVEFEKVTLSLPKEVLQNFFEEDILNLYEQNFDSLIEKILFLEKVDYQFNSKNIVTKMWKHI